MSTSRLILAVACVAFAVQAPAGDPRVKPIHPTGHAREVTSVALSVDGKRLVTGSFDTTAILWEAASGKQLQTFQGHTGDVHGVALSADGKKMVTGSRDKTAILWEAATGKKLQTFQGHTDEVSSVALSADGKQVVTGSYDKTAILWEAATGNKLQTFSAHAGEKDKADPRSELRAIKKELAELEAQIAVKEKELVDLRKKAAPLLAKVVEAKIRPIVDEAILQARRLYPHSPAEALQVLRDAEQEIYDTRWPSIGVVARQALLKRLSTAREEFVKKRK